MLTNNNYLKHYGIKGMKWGHRRKQTIVRSPTKKEKSVVEKFKDEFNKTTWTQKIAVTALSNTTAFTVTKMLANTNLTQQSISSIGTYTAIATDMVGMHAAKKYNEIIKQRR